MRSLLLKLKLTLFILLFVLECSYGQLAQTEMQRVMNNIDNQYGYSFVLTNGCKYTNAHSEALGSAFYLEDKQLGAAVIQGLRFDSIWLAYDLFQQQIIYCFKNNFGTEQQLVLNPTKIDTIEIYNGGLFIKNKFTELNNPFIDLIYKANMACYISWKKAYVMSNNVSSTTAAHEFSEAKKAVYISKNDHLIRIRSNNDFLKLLKPEATKTVKSQLKKENIKVSKASRFDLFQLMEYCYTNHLF